MYPSRLTQVPLPSAVYQSTAERCRIYSSEGYRDPFVPAYWNERLILSRDKNQLRENSLPLRASLSLDSFSVPILPSISFFIALFRSYFRVFPFVRGSKG